jgi:hypothetical protein
LVLLRRIDTGGIAPLAVHFPYVATTYEAYHSDMSRNNAEYFATAFARLRQEPDDEEEEDDDAGENGDDDDGEDDGYSE